ncbi:MAG: helix-turn-helix domain-containing protein [Myxococcaceae bacterium]
MKPFEEQSYYELLEISPSASEDEILAAVLRAEQVYAPDSVALYALEDPERVEVLRARLKQAFEVLSDPKLRVNYDQQLAAVAPVHSEMVGVQTTSRGFGEMSPDATWEERASEAQPPAEVEEPYEPMPSLFQAYRLVETSAPANEPDLDARSQGEVASHEPLSEQVIVQGETAADEHPLEGVGDSGSLAEASATQDEAQPPNGASVEPRAEAEEGKNVQASPPEQPAGGVDDTQRTNTAPVPIPPPSQMRDRVIASLELALRPEALPRDTLPEGLPVIRLPPPDAAMDAVRETPQPAPAPRMERVIMSDGGPVLITPRPASEPIPPSPARRGLRSLQKDAQQIASDNAIPLAETALAQVRARAGTPSSEARPRMLDIPPDAEFNGELLRQIRKSRGLNIQQLADKTRISLKHLENIEADRYDALPATVYLRGFLTSISREFGLDAIRVSKSYLGLVQRHKGSQ